jgi:riboflavin-specific deaminase-like protein
MGLIEDLPSLALEVRQNLGRPLVALCYAQSLDGSITARRGAPLALSGVESFAVAHRLRAACDAILVGIGTVLADNPRLTTRLVPGHDPQPVILDSQLRTPLDANLMKPGRSPWIITTQLAYEDRQNALEAAGAQVFRLPVCKDGGIDLHQTLQHLACLGIDSLMVEGGARVITAFLTRRLADYLVLTLAPVFVGGLRAVETPLFNGNTSALPRLERYQSERHGEDLVVLGKITW